MRIKGTKFALSLAASAFALSLPMTASADEAAMAEKIKALEAALAALKADMAAEKAKAPVAAAPAEGFKVGNTTVKFGGFVKVVGTFSDFSNGEVAANSSGRDFYLGQAIPTTVGGKGSQVFDAHAKQTRFTAALTSDVAGHTVKGYLEADLQSAPNATASSERVTNPYNPAIRRAFLQLDNWTIGQDWSTFQYLGSLPETTDFAGVLDGTVFNRQALVRYTKKLSDTATLHLGIENPETTSATTGATFADNDDDRIPDFVGRLQLTSKMGELSIAALARKLTVATSGVEESANGFGISIGGKMPIGADKKSNIGFMLTSGDGIGRYVAVGATPDAIISATGKLETVKTTDAFISAKFVVSPISRFNVMAGYHSADLPSGVLTTTQQAAFTKKMNSFAINYFITPVKNVDLGVEYRHAQREMFGGADGDLDRLEFAAKYTF